MMHVNLASIGNSHARPSDANSNSKDAPTTRQPSASHSPTGISKDFSQIAITHSCPGRIQPKLRIDPVDSPLEREADRVADAITRASAFTPSRSTSTLHRKCASCEAEEEGKKKDNLHSDERGGPAVHRMTDSTALPVKSKRFEETTQISGQVLASPTESAAPALQRKCADCEEEEKHKTVHRSPVGELPSHAPPIVHQVLSRTGRPLPEPTRSFFEARMGADLSDVRVHDDAHAAQSAESIMAKAYTVGSSIVFGDGEFSPDTQSGKHLLAHELTHVLQQRSQALGEVQRVFDNEPDPNSAQLQELQEQRLQAMSVSARIAEIRDILSETWVGPLDESRLEDLWDSFGSDLPTIVAQDDHFSLWQQSVDRGAELDDIRAVEQVKSRFESDVKAKMTKYLSKNRAQVLREMERFGAGGLTDPATAEQQHAVESTRQAAKQAAQVQDALDRLKAIPVGYERVYIPDELPSQRQYIEITSTFNPEKRPSIPPHGTEQPPLATWEDVKLQCDRLEGVLKSLYIRNPGLFAVTQQAEGEELSEATPEEARAIVVNSLASLLTNIETTIPKVDSGDLDYRDVGPIHAKLFQGEPSLSNTNWSQPFYQWVANDVLADHESKEFWISLGLGTLAAAAFVVAEIATAGTATFFIAAGVGVGATGLQVGRSWEHYFDLATAAEANVNPELALVSSGQASEALVTAVLDTAFAFLDLYGARRGIRAAVGAAEGAAARETLQAGEKKIASTATRDAAQIAERQGVEDIFEIAATRSPRGAKVKVSASGHIFVCRSPCELLREHFEKLRSHLVGTLGEDETLRIERNISYLETAARTRSIPADLIEVEAGMLHDEIFELAGVEPLVHGVDLPPIGAGRRLVGERGEAFARQVLSEKGFKEISAVQNASNHGLDIVAIGPDDSLVFFEVKTTSTGFMGNVGEPTARQKDPGSFIYDVLSKAAERKGAYKSVDPEVSARAQQYLGRFLKEQSALGSPNAYIIRVELGSGNIEIVPWRRR